MQTVYASKRQTNPVLGYLLLFLLTAGCWLADTQRGQAASFAPSCTNGQGDVAALRTAVATASSNGQADTITLATNCRYLLAQDSGGTLSFGADGGALTTIVGNGAAIDGGLVEPNTVIQIEANARVTINRLTIKGGNGQFDPVYVSGSGLVVNGELTLNHSTVTGNQATTYGGAVRQNAGATGNLTLNNSTVSNNRGSGIVVAGTVLLNNSTLADNSVFESELRFRAPNSRLTMNNTLIVPSGLGESCTSHPDATTIQVTAAHTLVLAATPCGLQNGVNGNRVVNSVQLEPLMGNPAYRPLSPGNPAINAGNNSLIPAGITTDQAGNPRIFASTVDIGAFESIFVAATVAIAPAASTVNEGGVATLSLTRSGGSDGVTTALNVPFTRGGSASAADYELRVNGAQLTQDVFVIPAGAAAVVVTVTALDDVAAEALEDIVFTLQSSVYYTIGSPAAATVAIPANDFVVTNRNDFSGAATPSQRQGTLRQALQNANDRAGDDTISFAVDGAITLAGGVLTVNNNGALTIEGNGITLSGNNATPVFGVNTGATASFKAMTIRDGIDLNGGGIFNQGNLTLERVTVTANRTAATGGTYYGGGINNLGTLTIRSSTISNNQAKTNGGGISNGGALTVINSTITGNSAGEQGGGIAGGAVGSVTVINSTIAGNRADISGGGLYHSNGMTLRNVIVADNQGGDCARFNTVAADVRHSLLEVAGCGITNGVNGNIVGQDPGLGPLTGGGALGTAFFMLPPGSRAIDAGNDSFVPADLTLDQAGNPRIFGNAVDLGSYESADALVTISPATSNVAEGGQVALTINRSGALDAPVTIHFNRSSAADFTLQLAGNALNSDEVTIPAGAATVVLTLTAVDDVAAEATESHAVTLLDSTEYNLGLAQIAAVTIPANDLVVTNLNDFTNATPVDSRGGTLRQAILNANSFASADTITFAVTGVVELSNGTLRTQGTALTTIEGAGITVDGNGNSTVLTIEGPTTINNLTITGGNGERGGGLLVSNVLTLNRSTVHGNRARFGGGIYNIFATVTINHSTIRNNHANEYSGGIWSDEPLDSNIVNLTINNSTISGNTASDNAGIGIWEGRVVINNSAIVDNIDDDIHNGLTGLFIQGQLEVNNSIISNGLWHQGTLYGYDCYFNFGTVTFRNTLIRRPWPNCPIPNGVNGNIVGQEPGLGTPMGNPAYYPLNADSLAINAGNNALIPTDLTVDQAGNPRIVGGTVDMGPIEFANVAPTPTSTAAPPTPTPTVLPPTATATNTTVPPTATNTAVPPTATNTTVPPTVTPTMTTLPPTATATNTAVPPTATNTALPPTATATPSPTPMGTVVGVCGSITVYRNAGKLTAPGWGGKLYVGTNGANTITGTGGRDLMLGLGGNDKLNGKGGDDLICGGDGVDLLTGEAGNDYLDGGAGNDVINGGAGSHDTLIADAGNDILLDGDGVISAQGGPGNDVFTIALHNGWRNQSGQATFHGLTGGYDNDNVGLAVFGTTPLLLDISGDERDNPASPLEGRNDLLLLLGVIDPASTLRKFEQQLVVTASAETQPQGFLIDPTTLTDTSGAEFLTEPVGGEEVAENEDAPATMAGPIYLPLIMTDAVGDATTEAGQSVTGDDARVEEDVTAETQSNRIFLPVINR